MSPGHPAEPQRPADERPLHVVFGASGYIGTNLVPELLRCGHRVRATARNLEVLEGRGWGGVERVRADALDPATLPAALAGADVAYYLVHSMAASFRPTRAPFTCCRARKPARCCGRGRCPSPRCAPA